MAAKWCLVTGGSGFLGINLIRFLLRLGYRVRSLDIAPFDYPEHALIETVLGDVRDPDSVRRAMQGVDLVVHAAAALPLAKPDDIRSTGIDGTGIVLAQAAAAGVSRFVFTSSTSVYGIPRHHPLLETDPLDGVGPYGESKIAAERLCEQARGREMCVAILRPKTFVGPERLGAFAILYEWAFERRGFPVLGAGANRYQLLDVSDLCEVIGRCLVLDPGRVDDTFNVGAKRFGSMRENVQSVLDRAGHGRRAVAIPAAPAIAALRLLRALGWSPLYEWIYETAACDSFVSIERLESRLGFTPRRSNEEALVANYDWYVEHRAEFLKRTGVSHRVPWEQGFLHWARLCF